MSLVKLDLVGGTGITSVDYYLDGKPLDYSSGL